jgi:hypothetical protein
MAPIKSGEKRLTKLSGHWQVVMVLKLGLGGKEYICLTKARNQIYRSPGQLRRKPTEQQVDEYTKALGHCKPRFMPVRVWLEPKGWVDVAVYEADHDHLE